jgi:DNA-directed RNA polymerase sigma subunit (sigma70/sigma32)
MVSNIQSDVEFTLEEISLALQIPKETCRQVLLMALRKLSSPKNQKKLEEIAELVAMIERV